ncbi:hypothetical protein Y717_14655 [Streptomyces scopuliridis RB72]|uniref:Uncharacterized protein n=1 Tax=Streptomyces scopuliridis RB72 TaxID=1440053 RepID=A0A2T7TET3_9ACTN|nr:hypothetical protein Y717_14655 [Streptomyces scopuliridis RB72]
MVIEAASDYWKPFYYVLSEGCWRTTLSGSGKIFVAVDHLGRTVGRSA